MWIVIADRKPLKMPDFRLFFATHKFLLPAAGRMMSPHQLDDS
jgi:hypothetical protein